MIKRFRKIDNNIYRGSAPSISDVIFLHKHFGIKTIISLDLIAGKKINRICKLLHVKHIMLPIEIGIRKSLINFLRHKPVKLMVENEPIFIHCEEGKDRTGFATMLYRVKHDGWTFEQALKESRALGYGIGVPHKIINLYNKIIQYAAKNSEDNNFAYDIVSNERDRPVAYDNSSYSPSWSPYSDYRISEWPFYNIMSANYPEQYSTRETYDLDDTVKDSSDPDYGYSQTPMSGQFDSSVSGISGSGFFGNSGYGQ
jgi:hypothetical protein